MSRNTIFAKGFSRTAVLIAALVQLAPDPSPARAAGLPFDESACRQAAVLALDDTLRVSPYPGSQHLYFRLEVFEAGVLHVEAIVPGTAGAEPVLVLEPGTCDGLEAPPRPTVLGRARASLLLALDGPGEHVFRLSSHSLPDFRISTGFVSRPQPQKAGEDEGEIELEPNPFTGSGKPQRAGEDEGEIELEPNPFAGDGKPQRAGEDEGEIELEPNPFAGGSGKTARVEICAGGTDDHADAFACATSLTPARAVAGEIANDWGDDVDVFRFELPGDPAADLWEVELAAAGPAATAGVLFDRGGRRLAAQDGGFRLREVLPPGTYFVRVEGASGAEGSYRLELRVTEP